MDNNQIIAQFEQIEKRVERLIDVCKSLEIQNSELKKRNEELEGELQGKIAAETQYMEERELVRSKVDALLAKLEDTSSEEQKQLL